MYMDAGPEESWPPLSTSVPMYTEPAPTRPSGSTCGQVSNGPLNGTFTSPGYPSYRHNLDCAYVVKVPKGYYIQFTLPNFAIEERYLFDHNIMLCRITIRHFFIISVLVVQGTTYNSTMVTH